MEKNHDIIEFGSPATNLKKTKKERKEEKLQKKLEWKTTTRNQWSGKSPNERHSLYYIAQIPGFVDEWSLFLSTMTKDLPVTFRLCNYRNSFVCYALEKRLQNQYRKIVGRFVSVNGNVINEVVAQVPWMRNAWQINCNGSTFSSDESLQPLYHMMLREISLGHITRQELVSMIPVELMDITSPNSCILDMCAAPGSKTEQILSHLTASAGSGMLIANDIDTKRIQILSRRYSRCHCPQLVLTCATSTKLRRRINARIFDRILCDVPCTGDGTFRKLPYLWRKFRPRFGVEIHPLQLTIAQDAITMLKTGGRMVYSTCSLNPIENEAVVAALLIWARQSEGLNLQLVDPTQDVARRLPGLKWRPGLTDWKCTNDLMLVGETEKSEVARSKQRLLPILPSMLPPSDSEILASLNLHRCMRLMPQDQNTGGFFVAILEIVPSASAITVEPSELHLTLLKKRKQKPMEEKSVKASKMRRGDVLVQLGYNPHTSQKESQGVSKHSSVGEIERLDLVSSSKDRKIKSSSWRLDTNATCYSPLGELSTPELLVDELCELTSLNPSDISVHTIEELREQVFQKNSKGYHLFYGDQNFHETPSPRDILASGSLSLVSSSVATVLSSWGRKGDVVVQAGVIVARINLNNEGKDASYETSLLSLDADAAKYLFGKDSCSLRGRRAALSIRDFKAVLQASAEVMVTSVAALSTSADEESEGEGEEVAGGRGGDVYQPTDYVVDLADVIDASSASSLMADIRDMSCFVLLVDSSLGIPLPPPAVGAGGAKRRVSKAERKKMAKNGSLASQSSHTEQLLSTTCCDVSDVLLLVQKIDDTILKILTPADAVTSLLCAFDIYFPYDVEY